MSDNQEQTQNTSFGEILAGDKATPAPEPTVEKPAEGAATLEADTAPKPTEPVTEPPKETAPPPPPATEPDKAVSGVLKGIQAERKKRQLAEQQLAELRAQLGQQQAYEPQYQPDPQVNEELSKKTEMRILSISESSARAAHSDFQEKFNTFVEEAQTNNALYDSVINSDHPGEAAYQAGKILQAQKKYGIDFDSQYSNIRKEVEAELVPKIRAQLEAEFSGKVQNKLNQPTNILSARSAGDGGPPPFRPTSFGDLLGGKRR